MSGNIVAATKRDKLEVSMKSDAWSGGHLVEQKRIARYTTIPTPDICLPKNWGKMPGEKPRRQIKATLRISRLYNDDGTESWWSATVDTKHSRFQIETHTRPGAMRAARKAANALGWIIEGEK